jgi:hypothetical protein
MKPSVIRDRESINHPPDFADLSSGAHSRDPLGSSGLRLLKEKQRAKIRK